MLDFANGHYTGMSLEGLKPVQTKTADRKSGGPRYHQRMDLSNGYEAVSKEFLARRGSSSTRRTGIGVKEVREWARTLPRGSSVIDLGCGPGFPITLVLVEEGLHVFGVDAAPSFVAAFQRNLPGTPIACEAVQGSRFFGRVFDAVLAWGLMFLLKAEDQHRLIQKFAEMLVPGGRLLFTATAKPTVGNDAMTGLESVSLGAEQYRKLLEAVGISVAEEYQDEGENHYFDAFKGSERGPAVLGSAAFPCAQTKTADRKTGGPRYLLLASREK